MIKNLVFCLWSCQASCDAPTFANNSAIWLFTPLLVVVDPVVFDGLAGSPNALRTFHLRNAHGRAFACLQHCSSLGCGWFKIKWTLCLQDRSIYLGYGEREKLVEQVNATMISIRLGNAEEQNFQFGILTTVKMSAGSCF